LCIGQICIVVEEAEGAGGMGCGDRLEAQPAEQAGEHAHRRKNPVSLIVAGLLTGKRTVQSAYWGHVRIFWLSVL